MYKEDVGWIVDLNNFLASWSLQSGGGELCSRGFHFSQRGF